MKRSILTFFSAALLVVSTAQTSKTSGVSKTNGGSSNSHSTSSNSSGNTKSSHTYTSSGSASHSSKSSSNYSRPKSTNHTYFEQTSTVDNSTYVNDSKTTKPEITVENTETTDQNNTGNVQYCITPIKYKKTNVIDDSYRTERGGITRVGIPNNEVVNYEDNHKVTPVDTQGDNSTTDTDTTNVNQEGLSSALKSDNSKKPGRREIISCESFYVMDSVQRISILSGFENYDITTLHNTCSELLYPKDILIISCLEFERSSVERKEHILNFPNFYSVSGLYPCNALTDYLKSRE